MIPMHKRLYLVNLSSHVNGEDWEDLDRCRVTISTLSQKPTPRWSSAVSGASAEPTSRSAQRGLDELFVAVQLAKNA
jgi:hypothetical protein